MCLQSIFSSGYAVRLYAEYDKSPSLHIALSRLLYQSELYLIPKRVKENTFVSASGDDDAFVYFFGSVINKRTDFFQ